MKTIGYIDRADGSGTLKAFYKDDGDQLFRQGKKERIIEAMENLVGMGNIKLFLITGRGVREIGVRGLN